MYEVETGFISFCRKYTLCKWKKHFWERVETEHGKDAKRWCVYCGKVQWMAYHKFGPTRYSWRDYVTSERKLP